MLAEARPASAIARQAPPTGRSVAGPGTDVAPPNANAATRISARPPSDAASRSAPVSRTRPARQASAPAPNPPPPGGEAAPPPPTPPGGGGGAVEREPARRGRVVGAPRQDEGECEGADG